MLTRQTAPAAATRPTGPVRGFGIPQIALRRRSHEHPMAMFAVIVTAAFASMVALSSQGPATAAPGAPVRIADMSRTTEKTDRLPASEAQRTCRGQAWGNESLECLVMIAREAGKAEGQIRMVAAAPNRDAPNVF